MKDKTHDKPEISALRNQAEEALLKNDAERDIELIDSDLKELLHDLDVSQNELELLHEELRLERAKSEIAIEKFTTLYDEFYDFSPVGYFILNRNGIITDLNTSSTKLLGKERALLVNKSINTFISQESAAVFGVFLQKITNNKTKESCDVRLITNERALIYVHLEGIFSENNQKCLIAAVDISDRKMAENALRESEEKFKSAFDFPYIGKAIFNMDGYFIEANDALCQMFGFGPNELYNVRVQEFSHPEDYVKDKMLFDEILEKKRDSYEIEKRYFHKDGHIVYTILSVKVIFNAAGDPVYGISQIVDFTKMKLAETALKTSEAIFDQFMENSPIYVFFKDENIRSLRLSRNFEKMIGKPMNELLNKNMDELFPSDLAKSMVANDNQILKEGKRNDVQEEFNGRVYSTTKFPIHVEGKPDYLAGFSIDITDSQLAELALVKSEEKYRKLHESLRDGYVYVSMDGVVQDSNKVFQDLLGYTPADLQKLTYVDLTPTKWHSTEARIVNEEILPLGYSSVYEKEYCKKDGAIIPVELRAFLISDSDGQPQGMWAIVRDISERKQAEEILRASEEKFKSIVESSPTAMHFYNLQNDDRLIFIGANPAAELVLGISHKLLIGKTIEEAFPNLAETEIPELYKKIARGEQSHHSFEISYQEERFSGHYNVSVFRTARNTIAADFIDISDRKKTEEKLRQNETRLIELNATKDKFFSIIAHDLKNPFNSILGFSEMLKLEAKHLENSSIGNYASLINTASRYTYQLLENLLTWARMQNGTVPFSPRSLIVEQLVRDEFEIARPNAGQKKITLTSDVPKSLIIGADENMFRNILRNLVSNAVKFTPKGGEVHLSAEVVDAAVVISVTDNGVGMKPDDIEKLFKIETNFSTRGTESEKGTGLGLLLCKEFVEKHGGKIWIESKEGIGSKFSFTIPAL